MPRPLLRPATAQLFECDLTPSGCVFHLDIYIYITVQLAPIPQRTRPVQGKDINNARPNNSGL